MEQWDLENSKASNSRRSLIDNSWWFSEQQDSFGISRAAQLILQTLAL